MSVATITASKSFSKGSLSRRSLPWNRSSSLDILAIFDTRTQGRGMIDEIDKRLLAALQANAQLTSQELGEVLNLSPSQAGRRRQRLEESGLIRAYAARIDARKVGLTIQAFVQVQMDRHTADAAKAFASMVSHQPEVVSAWTMTGEADYLLRVYCADLPALNRLIHDVLLGHPSVARVHSQIVMHQFKQDAALPV